MHKSSRRLFVSSGPARARSAGCPWLHAGVCALLLGLTTRELGAVSFPAGFSQTTIAGPVNGTWDDANGILFDENGRMYVWERAGRIWLRPSSTASWVLLLDIVEEVGYWRDHGLLNVALDPNFQTNGYLYLLYAVDRHHLLHFGTSTYDPAADEPSSATIGRITRYTARASDGFTSVDEATRLVLLGASPSTGFPITQNSHGVGTLLFGADGTLLASCGDGAHISLRDRGNATGSHYAQALADGIITQDENVGSFRAQMVDSLSGKIIRIDPVTGRGIPSNPFYDATRPSAARSKVWALGLRNPFRMSLQPHTGSHDRADADPGVIMIGDVGDIGWEELDVCTEGGQNFGWPLFEGGDPHPGFSTDNVRNRLAPNPLSNGGTCPTLFLFRDLIKQGTRAAAGQPPFANPCDTAQKIPVSIPQFLHTPPALEWDRDRDLVRTWIYDANGAAVGVNIQDPSSGITGNQFRGNCSIGGVWYTGSAFPQSYHDTYFHAEFGGRWIRNLTFDASGKLTTIRGFMNFGDMIISLAENPADGALYYTAATEEMTSVVRRIAYAPSGNLPPIAVASADKIYGSAPLVVKFTGNTSSDPEGQTLRYDWDFGDGTAHGTTANPTHTFQAPAGTVRRFDVVLTVTDSAGQTAQANLLISVNNTPPTVSITSPAIGTKYSMQRDTMYELTASVSDRESPDADLQYAWQTFLHHNEHNHPEPVDTNHRTTALIEPIGCDGNTYYYRIVLTVTDPGGLSAQDEVILEPDCGQSPSPDDPGRLINVSIRGRTAGGERTLIAGFHVGGSGSQELLLRSAGPSLAGMSVTGFLADPILRLFQGTTVLAGNDNWGGAAAVIDATSRAQAFAFAGSSSRDAAMVRTLQPGGYTAHAAPRDPAASGIVLAECYAPDGATTPGTARLINLSGRGYVGDGEAVIIAGFVVAGSEPVRILLRAVGPTLADHGVAEVLTDPILELYAGSALNNSNDDWNGDTAVVNATTAVAAFPLQAGSKDAAMVVTLPAGAYTAHVRGVGGAVGVGLVELYHLP